MNCEMEKSKNVLKCMFALLLLLLCLQKLTIIEFSGGAFGLKAGHVYSLVFLPLLLKVKRVFLPPIYITGFIVYLLILSVVMFTVYGFSNVFFNYVFGFYLMVIIFTLGYSFDAESWRSIVCFVAWAMLFIVLVNLAFQYDLILAFLNDPKTHPAVTTVFSGGVNLESSWLGLLGFAMYKSKRAFAYAFTVLAISGMYASRAGIVASCFLLFYLFFQDFELKKMTRKQWKGLMCSAMIGVLIMLYLLQTGVFDFVIERFMNIGSDSGSTARFRMWQYIIEAFQLNPIGYGVGNGITAIELVSGGTYGESNLHNLYMQMLIDAGLLGLLYYTALTIALLWDAVKYFFKNPFLAFLIGYLGLSLVQYRGGDSIMMYILGVYLLTRNQYVHKMV